MSEPGFTRLLALHAHELGRHALPSDVVGIARHCVLDWLGVTLAGCRDPLTQILRETMAEERGAGVATLVGHGDRMTARQAALVNGAASHVLDMDDVHLPSRVHPSVAVLPAAVAMAQANKADGRALIAAFVTGVEIQSRVALWLGAGHYRRGWHSTGTLGIFGAAAAVSVLDQLSSDQILNAFGIAGTSASGLRASFGTMCKPLHAGNVGAAAILAARLARRGFTGRTDLFECHEGFAQTMADPVERAQELDAEHFHTREIIFKNHSSCYGTHAPIEAALRLKETVNPGDVLHIDVKVEPQYLDVCCIPEPGNGIEARFSIAHAVSLALWGRDTASSDSFSAAAVQDAALASLRKRVRVRAAEGMPRATAEVTVTLADNQTVSQRFDASVPESDLDRQRQDVERKFRALAVPLIGAGRAEEAIQMCRELEQLGSLEPLLDACRFESPARAASSSAPEKII